MSLRQVNQTLYVIEYEHRMLSVGFQLVEPIAQRSGTVFGCWARF